MHAGVSSSSPPDRADAAWILLLAALVATAMARQRALAWDDPYILFRYAENLANGHGWTFNPGTSTDNAVTSPAVVMVLTALRAARVPMFAAGAVLFHASMTCAAWFTGRALAVSGNRTAGTIAAIAVATSPALVSMWGMESGAYLALVAVVAWLSQITTKWWDLGIVVGMLGLVRPDALLTGTCVAIVTLFVARRLPRNRGPLVRLVVPAVAPLAIFSIVMLVITGDVVPSTLSAKRAQGSSGTWTTFASWSDATSKWPWGLRGSLAPATEAGDVFVAIALAFVVLGLVLIVRRRRGWTLCLALLLSSISAAIVYGAVLRVASSPWYWTIPVYALTVTASLGLAWLVDAMRRPGLIHALLAASVVLVPVTQLRNVRDFSTSPRREYDEIGNWIRRNTPEESTVATFEIGRVGFVSRRTIIDPLGLLDDDLARFVAAGDLTSWLAETQPDYWVLSVGFIDAPLRRSPCLADHFTEVFRTRSFTVEKRTSRIADGRDCAIDSD